MAGLSTVIVLDPDPRAGQQVQLGFEREGVRAVTASVPASPDQLELGTEGLGLIVIGGGEESLELVRVAREILEAKHLDVPILFAGRVARREDAETAGADEVVIRPAYLRDVVTIGRLLNGVPAEKRLHIIGNLGELTNVFTLVRALSALGRSATLTLMRGLRRGEIRFFHGEVTSAQVGLIHGQAAFHQLLLWTDARFDFHHEDVVRRQQIPLSHDELFADAERFLVGIKESAGPLSPAMVLEQDVARLHSLGKQIPTEVHGVLRMFDGHRVLADVLEDSPYRVFETLRVAQRALEAGLLRVVQSQRPKATWRAVLSIEEWLVGGTTERDPADPPPEPEPSAGDSSPKLPTGNKEKRGNRKARRANAPSTPPTAVAPSKTIDWGALVPRVIGSDVGTLAGVVPAAKTSGEIELPSRELEREKLEALMDTGKRDKIFPSELGTEPSVVFDDRSGPIPTSVRDADTEEEVPTIFSPEPVKPRTATGKVRDEAQVRVKELVKKHQASDRVASILESARREVRTRLASGESEKIRRTPTEVTPKIVDPRLAAEAKARADAELATAAAKAATEAEVARVAAVAKVAADAKVLAEAIATKVPEPQAKPTEATHFDEAAAGEFEGSATSLVRALVSEVNTAWESPDPEPAQEPTTEFVKLPSQSRTTTTRGANAPITRPNAEAHPIAELVDVESHPLAALPISQTVQKVVAPVAPVAPITKPAIAPIAVSGISAAVANADTVPLGRRAHTIEPPANELPDDDRPKDAGGELNSRKPARITMQPLSREPSILIDNLATAAKSVAAVATKVTLSVTPPTPQAPVQAPVAAPQAAVATPPVVNATPPVATPIAVEPIAKPVIVVAKAEPVEAKPTKTKTIPPPESARTKTKSTPPSERAGSKTNPPIASARTKTKQPTGANVSVESKVARTPNLATPEREKQISEVRKDAVAFSDDEEAFFASANDKTAQPALIAAESFDDLDEGYKPVGFWDRVFGRKKNHTTNPDPVPPEPKPTTPSKKPTKR